MPQALRMASGTSSYRRHLPHLRREGATYLVTWVIARGTEDLRPEERRLVLDAVAHFDGDRYSLLAAVVMNDHVHALVRPATGHDLSKILHSWKSFSAHQLVRAGRRAPVWLDEYHDTIIRDGAHLQQAIRYIELNPRKRWPSLNGYEWLYVTPPASGRQEEVE